MSGTTTNLNTLRARGRMTWSESEHGWIASPDEVRDALAADGFHECVRDPARPEVAPPTESGVWLGVNPTTRTVASLTWTPRAPGLSTTVHIEIDGQSITRPGRDPVEEEGGQG